LFSIFVSKAITVQKRHSDPELYFNELSRTMEKYVLPPLEKYLNVKPGLKVCEVGCGIAGNLNPFAKRGCTVYGIDIEERKIKSSQKLLAGNQVHLIVADILKFESDTQFDLIILRDTIEHIYDKKLLLEKIYVMLKPNGFLYIAFPPWRMPFGGHQQICRNRFFSQLPYYHLLPSFIYPRFLKFFGENEEVRNGLKRDQATGISIAGCRRILKNQGFVTREETRYLINPHYEMKFGLRPRKLARFLQVPWLQDFYTTAYSCILSRK
jgi:SAM-dependent methyltransferase